MGLCKKQKKYRPPLKPREGPYKTVNSYKLKPSFQQIFAFILALSVIILHSIFEVAAIIKIDNPILFIILALHYVLIVIIIYLYVRITIFDPVDTYILDPELADKEANRKQMSYCNLCRSKIHEKSYHCKRCNRCTQNFDHHCSFLNNCIGSRNYELFFSLLLMYIVFMIVNIGQGIWVFIVSIKDPVVSNASITQWVPLLIAAICFIQLLATGILLGFHCYISCCLDLTTIQFYQSDSTQKNSDKNHHQTSQPSQNNSPFNFISMNHDGNNPTLNNLFQKV